MNDGLRFRISIFERFKSDNWEFIGFIENNDKWGISLNGNVIHHGVRDFHVFLPREKTPQNIYIEQWKLNDAPGVEIRMAS